MRSSGGLVTLQVQDVKFVGCRRENLISVSKLTRRRRIVRQTGSNDEEGQTIDRNGQPLGHLYELEIELLPVVSRASKSHRRQYIMVIPIFLNQERKKLELDGHED